MNRSRAIVQKGIRAKHGFARFVAARLAAGHIVRVRQTTSQGEGTRTVQESLENDGDEPQAAVIEPLRKRKAGSGSPYTRPTEIEQILTLLMSLSLDEAIARARIRNRHSVGWLPGECLLHMTRRAARMRDMRAYGRWYDQLAERVRAGLPRPASKNRPAARELEIADAGFDRFIIMLTADLNGYDDRLDIWEARFDLALINLRRDALKKTLRKPEAPEMVDIDGDPLIAAEAALKQGEDNPVADALLNENDFRSRYFEAIDALPTEQNRIITMTAEGIPVGTGAAGEQSISGLLGMSPRMVNYHKNRAIEAIRCAMEGGEA